MNQTAAPARLLDQARPGTLWRRRARVMGYAAAGAYVAVTAWLLQGAYDVAGGVMVAHLLLLPTIPLIRRLTRDEEPFVRRIITAGLTLKLVGTLLRFGVMPVVYGSGGDAAGYDGVGGRLAEGFRDGRFDVELGWDLLGTTFMEVLTGLLYVLTGTAKLAGFIVFSWWGFLGLCLFYRAFRLAVPDGDRRRYALLVFFLPSLWFWPSSIGKEAWMTLTLGVAAYGVAKLVTHGRWAFLWLALGCLGTAMVRPHVTITVVLSAIAAYVFTTDRRDSYSAALAKLTNLLVLLVLFGFVLAAVGNFLNFDSFDAASVQDELDQTVERTATGSSEFETAAVRSPVQIPFAVVSVLFRPFPFEAGNAQGLVASIEGMVVLVGILRSRHRLRAAARAWRRTPYLVFAATYSILFCVAFSSVSNFGILARQRVQLYPFLLVLLAVPTLREQRGDGEPAEAAGGVSAGQRPR